MHCVLHAENYIKRYAKNKASPNWLFQEMVQGHIDIAWGRHTVPGYQHVEVAAFTTQCRCAAK